MLFMELCDTNDFKCIYSVVSSSQMQMNCMEVRRRGKKNLRIQLQTSFTEIMPVNAKYK